MFTHLFRRFANRHLQGSPIPIHRDQTKSRRRVAGAVNSAIESLEGRTMFSFSAPVSYTATTGPVAMVSADLNGDGRADLISTNSGGSVTALLGNGDATFQTAKTSTLGLNRPGSSYTGSQAGTLTPIDFNGDGRMDVATVSGTNVDLLLGNGDGTFQAPIVSYVGSSPARISTGDLNADGHADLVVANAYGTVNVLLGNGDGTFAPPVSYAAGSSPQDVKAVDLNHDGKLDLVVADAVSAGSVSTLIGNGDGTFQPYVSHAAFSAPYRMQVEDVNGDGNPDVIVANSYTSSCVTVLLGNPDGTFKPYHSYDSGSQPWELNVVDVDGDGKKDLVSSNGSTYQIQLNNGDGTFSAPTTTPGAGLAFVAADFNGDGVADIAGANLSSVGVLVNGAIAATNVSTAVSLNVSAPATTAAGVALPLTITAVDVNGNTVADFLGSVHVLTTDARMMGFTYNFIATDAGTHTFAGGVALYTLGTQTITANGPAALTGSLSVVVTGAPASRFVIAADATVVAGNQAAFTLTASDNFGNLAADYTGTVHFTSTDLQAGLPTDYTFTTADAGTHSFTATMKTAALQNIMARDTITAATVGVSTSILVTPTVVSSLSLVGGGGHIGSAHTLTVTARDIFGNIATSYSGTVHLSSSDAQAILGANAPLVNGIGYFSVTPVTLGTQTLTATDIATPALTASETIVGTPGNAAKFVTTKIGNALAGTAQNVTITAYDNFGNVAVDYAGTVVFSSTDLQASLPYYTFTAADNGTHTFSVTLRTAGTQSLTVRDYGNGLISNTQTGIIITAGTATSITTTLLTGGVAGTNLSFTVKASDSFGNAASGYRGTIRLTTSDVLSTLPATYTFTAADNGVHTFNFAFKSSGGQTLTVQDSTNPTWMTFQRDIFVTPAALAGFAFRSPSNATTGTAFTATLSAVDAFGNTITGYTGKVHFTGPSGGGNLLPVDYTFTAADSGAHLFSFTLASTGTQTINVADTLNGSLKGSFSIVLKSGSTSTGGGTGGGGKKV